MVTSEPPSIWICPYFKYMNTNTDEILKIWKVLDNSVNILYVELIVKYAKSVYLKEGLDKESLDEKVFQETGNSQAHDFK